MFLGKLNKINLEKILACIALAFLLEAAFMPEFSARFSSFHAEPEKTDEMLGYVQDILKENRTGLGGIEELKLAEVILVESVAHKIDPVFVLALIKTESTFYNWSRSFTGAMGLMQILPSTGRELARQMRLKWEGDHTLLDPYANVRMGVHYLSDLKKRYKDTEMTLAAYNVGPTQLDSGEKDGEMPGQAFAKRVLTNYRHLKERVEF